MVEIPRREGEVEVRLVRSISYNRRCKWGCRDARDKNGEIRSILSREEWGCIATKLTWQEYKNASGIVVWIRMVRMGLLIVGGVN